MVNRPAPRPQSHASSGRAAAPYPWCCNLTRSDPTSPQQATA